MQALKFLHKLLDKASVIKHSKRLGSLLRAVESVTRQGKLSLTSIGRHLAGNAKVKNKIKAVDKLLGNGQLMNEREKIYEVIAHNLLNGLNEATIIIDWSSCESHEQHMLKASVVMRGRSMTLHEEVHEEKELGKLAVHRKFLERLQNKIPEGCHAIIETDAGFRTEWFELVREMGWDFIGRIRSNMLFKRMGESEWAPCSSLYSQANGKPTYLGEALLSKERSLPCSMYLYHEKKSSTKNNNNRKRKISSGKMEQSYRRSYKEPWLLVTSLPSGQRHADQMIRHYRCRMRIEHEFRNTKNAQWGIGLEYTRTKDIQRLQLLLLIGSLAIYVLWLTGLAAEQKKLHYDYQANTIKKYRVLSLVYLGLQILLHQPNSITEVDLLNAFNEVRRACY